jgi:EAL domain-containing protein (putative c-di-GMP-specific phosphodiesterase class I)
MPTRESQPILLTLDDDDEIADVLRAIGERAGFFVVPMTAADPFKEALRQYAPEVIVLDLQMPEMDGVEALRYLADQRIKAGIVLVTGMDERTIASAEQYGTSRGLKILATLQKPFHPEELLEKLLTAKAATQPLTAADLHKAMERDELAVYYQPTIKRFADGTWDITAVEALLRWNHPERGLLAPDAFIEMGETHGLSRAMTDLVIQRGIEQLKGWQAQKLDLGLRVNVAATLITDLGFPDRLQAVFTANEIEPSLLTMEITETAMLDQHADTFDILTRLRVKKINLAIDDFGIGYSSLTQLFRLPFNEMKIDRSLVAKVPQSKEARIMVEALIELAHKLNLSVCAEGVETDEALDFLDSVQCDSAQGFLVSPPVAPKELPDVIEGWNKRRNRRLERRLG